LSYWEPETIIRIIRDFNGWNTLIIRTNIKHENDPEEDVDPQNYYLEELWIGFFIDIFIYLEFKYMMDDTG